MGNRNRPGSVIVSVNVCGLVTVDDYTYEIEKSTWNGDGVYSWDLARAGDQVTITDESWSTYPTPEQIEDAINVSDEVEACGRCSRRSPTATMHHHDELGSLCDRYCWDSRLG